jgi:DNA-binding transcriptional regulator LsrR (DeoR family)
LTIELEQIKRARYAIGVAESLEKVSGILGALNGGYMNVLVTTEETAQKILE